MLAGFSIWFNLWRLLNLCSTSLTVYPELFVIIFWLKILRTSFTMLWNQRFWLSDSAKKIMQERVWNRFWSFFLFIVSFFFLLGFSRLWNSSVRPTQKGWLPLTFGGLWATCKLLLGIDKEQFAEVPSKT